MATTDTQHETETHRYNLNGESKKSTQMSGAPSGQNSQEASKMSKDTNKRVGTETGPKRPEASSGEEKGKTLENILQASIRPFRGKGNNSWLIPPVIAGTIVGVVAAAAWKSKQSKSLTRRTLEDARQNIHRVKERIEDVIKNRGGDLKELAEEANEKRERVTSNLAERAESASHDILDDVLSGLNELGPELHTVIGKTRQLGEAAAKHPLVTTCAVGVLGTVAREILKHGTQTYFDSRDDRSRPSRGTAYEKWSKNELYDRARELDISGRSNMTRDELIEALRGN